MRTARRLTGFVFFFHAAVPYMSMCMTHPLVALVALYAGALGLKLLLLPAYRSTDFEVHRHWMALTAKLPFDNWYLDETSEWTLDYPPLFAWFERLLACGGERVEPQMLTLSAVPYVSAATVAYQRCSVIAFDLLLLGGAASLAVSLAPAATQRVKPRAAASHWRWLVPTALSFCDAGALLVDHVHFQYNGPMIGLLLLSCAALVRGRQLAAAALFAVLLNLKHLFLFAAPFFFSHLLAAHVLRRPAPRIAAAAAESAGAANCAGGGRGAVARFAALAALVLAVFGVSFGPFAAAGQLGAVLRRLFPFGRSL